MPAYRAPYHRYWFTQQEEEAVLRVMRSGWLTSGPEVRALEEAAAAYLGAGTVAAVSGCTTGLLLLLRCLDLQPGDEVITTPMTFVATANVIEQAGGALVLADVDPHSLNLDPAAVARRITPRTRALLPVHLAGHPAQMDQLLQLAQEHKLAVIQDGAHAFEAQWRGRPLAQLGDGVSYSFYPNKNLTAGEGGLLATPHTEWAPRLRALRNHGLTRDSLTRDQDTAYTPYDLHEPGYKAGMTEIQAAIGRIQLNRLPHFAQRRNQRVAQYLEGLANIPGIYPTLPLPESTSAWHLMLVQLELEQFRTGRNELYQAIQEAGVQLSVPYRPVHTFRYYSSRFPAAELPEATNAFHRLFALPLYPLQEAEEVTYILEVLQQVLNRYRR